MSTTDTEVQNLIVNKLPYASWKAAKSAGTLSATEAYEITNIDTVLEAETTARQNADNNLQGQIDAITAASDVTDIVGTKAALNNYDTSSLPPNSIIKVLQDESQNNETTYYRWVITGGTGSWTLIGEEGPYYTKSEANSTFVAKTDVQSTYSATGTNPVNGTAVASAISTKQNTITGAATTIASSDLTKNRALLSDNSGKVAVSSITNTELGYLSGVTSAIQTQLNAKANNTVFTGADGTNAGTTGLVPAPAATDNTKFLRGDGTWVASTASTSWGSITGTLSNQTDLNTALGNKANNTNFVKSGSTAAAGLVPAPSTTAGTSKYLREDASWQTPPDTKNTAGSTDTSSKIFLVGATSQAANPQTYSHDTAFVDANGRLNSAAPASGANDTTVATTKWVKDQAYAANSDVVKLKGNQTISGVKNFGNSADSYTLTIIGKSNDETSKAALLLHVPSKRYSLLKVQGDTQGVQVRTGNDSDYDSLYCKTESSSDNSNKVATTAFVKSNLSSKQDTLVSGTNIKTINNTSLLGSGNINTLTDDSFDVVHVVVETYQNGTNWYRIYDDGWCEQGGIFERAATGIQNITLHKEFKSMNYFIQATNQAADTYTSAATFYTAYVLNKTVSGFSLSSNANISYIKYFVWEAKGFIG